MQSALLFALVLVAVSYVQAQYKPPHQLVKSDDEFLNQCLASTNYYRRHHGANDLIIDPTLVQYAQQRCMEVSKFTELYEQHRGLKEGFGENLAYNSMCGFGKNKFSYSCAEAIDDWYSEIANYTFETAQPIYPDAMTGHFTQLVWKNTQRMGCARCGGYFDNNQCYEYYIACNYQEPGNFNNDYRENVGYAPQYATPTAIKRAPRVHSITISPDEQPKNENDLNRLVDKYINDYQAGDNISLSIVPSVVNHNTPIGNYQQQNQQPALRPAYGNVAGQFPPMGYGNGQQQPWWPSNTQFGGLNANTWGQFGNGIQQVASVGPNGGGYSVSQYSGPDGHTLSVSGNVNGQPFKWSSNNYHG